MFAGGASNLAPGSHHLFKYSIRSLPPSRPTTDAETNAAAHPLSAVNAWEFFSIPPKAEMRAEGRFRIHAEDGIYGSPEGTAEAILAGELLRMTGLRLGVQFLGGRSANRGIMIERVSRNARPDFPPEAFEIAATSQQLEIGRASCRERV